MGFCYQTTPSLSPDCTICAYKEAHSLTNLARSQPTEYRIVCAYLNVYQSRYHSKSWQRWTWSECNTLLMSFPQPLVTKQIHIHSRTGTMNVARSLVESLSHLIFLIKQGWSNNFWALKHLRTYPVFFSLLPQKLLKVQEWKNGHFQYLSHPVCNVMFTNVLANT